LIFDKFNELIFGMVVSLSNQIFIASIILSTDSFLVFILALFITVKFLIMFEYYHLFLWEADLSDSSMYLPAFFIKLLYFDEMTEVKQYWFKL